VTDDRPTPAVLYLHEPTWSALTGRWPLVSRILVIVPLFIVVSEFVLLIGLVVRPDSEIRRLLDPFTFAAALVALLAMWMMKGRWFPYHLVDGVVIGRTGPRWHYRPLPRYWVPFANILREKSRFAVWEQYEGHRMGPPSEGAPAMNLVKAKDHRSEFEAPFRDLYPDRGIVRFPYDTERTDVGAVAAALVERFAPGEQMG